MRLKIRTDYLQEVYHVKRFQKMIATAVTDLQKIDKKTPFTAIAFTGHSGAALAYPISYILGKPLICVRKKTDCSHYDDSVEGASTAKSYLIVDDCICSGETIDHIVKAISAGRRVKPVGIYLYDDSDKGGDRASHKGIPIHLQYLD